MNFKTLFAAALTLTVLFNAGADTSVTLSELGVSMYLPDNWVATSSGDTMVVLSDSTLTYQSQIVVKKHAVDETEYSAVGDWTRSHFIAYLLVVNYSYDPFGAVLYFDSSAASLQDSIWAPESFSEFYSLDTTLGAWNEYMRYTESGSNGYEIYALGDTADMKMNIGMYMGLIRMITIDNESKDPITVVNHTIARNALVRPMNTVNSGVFDLLGKRRAALKNSVNGIYYRAETRTLQLNVK